MSGKLAFKYYLFISLLDNIWDSIKAKLTVFSSNELNNVVIEHCYFHGITYPVLLCTKMHMGIRYHYTFTDFELLNDLRNTYGDLFKLIVFTIFDGFQSEIDGTYLLQVLNTQEKILIRFDITEKLMMVCQKDATINKLLRG